MDKLIKAICCDNCLMSEMIVLDVSRVEHAVRYNVAAEMLCITDRGGFVWSSSPGP